MLILNFESVTRFQNFRKNNHHFDSIFIRNKFSTCKLEQQLDTDLKEKLNIVSLLEFYINYLAKKKYIQILNHDITFCEYLGKYLHIQEAIFKYI